MPSKPRSSFELPGLELSREDTLMNSRVVETLALLSNTRTEPVFSAMYQRALLLGSWSMAMGCEKFGRFAKAREMAMDTVPVGGSPARQVVFEGRLSSPPTGGVPPVVAFTAADAAETFAGVAPSTATIVYEYCVAGLNPLSA